MMVRRNNIRGTLAGFWSPEHTTSLNIPGYHFHFLADDHSSGGHVLDVQAAELQVELDLQSNLRLALPQTCLLYTSPSPRDATLSRMPSSA